MLSHPSIRFALSISFTLTVCVTQEASAARPLSIDKARVTVTGFDFNRPASFPGRGEFGWPGNIARAQNGELLMVHSAGYYHVSFAQPRLIEKETRRRWLKQGWPLDFRAPTGGRSMITRSVDNGKTWSQPQTLVDLPLDDSPYGLLRARDHSLLCFINVQASWYGFKKAPAAFQNDIDGLNTQQCVVRSTDDGQTWSEPTWLKSPGDLYERSHAQPVLLADGGILWPTYFSDSSSSHLSGAIHRSDDHGKTWKHISTVRRDNQHVDEPAVVQLKDGRLFMVSRPDGGMFYSTDNGVTWMQDARRLIDQGTFKAPRLFVMNDNTIVCLCTYRHLCVFIGKEGGKSWTGPVAIDRSAYGYPAGTKLEDESILVSYCSSGRAPNRLYVAKFQVNANRDGIELLDIRSRL